MTSRAVRRVVALASPIVVALSLASSPAAAAAPRATPSPADWLVWTPSTHTVTLTLIAGYNGARHGFNFNGYSTGSMVIQIPVGTHVQVIFHNHARFPHSAVITAYQNHTRDSAQGFPLAFAGASTPRANQGTPPGATQRFAFVASRPGRYALVCGVAQHARMGMWDTFQVTWGGEPGLIIPQAGS